MKAKRLIKLAKKMPESISPVQAAEFVVLLAAAEKAEGMDSADMSDVKKALGAAFRRMRTQPGVGLTQVQFCEKAGLTQQQLSLIETGKAALNAYAPVFFSLSYLGTEKLLEKAGEMEASWGLKDAPAAV